MKIAESVVRLYTPDEKKKNTISKTFPELYKEWGADSEISKYVRHILKIQNQEGIIRNVSESASLILYISALFSNQLL